MATNNSINNSLPSGVTVSGGTVSIDSGTSTLGISTDAAATTISVGTGAGVKAVTVGSTNTTSSTTINFGGSSGGALSTYISSASWTPTLNFGGGTTGITYSTRTGTYMRIGSLVYFTCNIDLSNKGSSTGAVSITGLPVSSSTGGVVSWRAGSVVFTGTITTRVSGTSIFMDGLTAAGSLSQIQDTAFSNSSTLIISGSYLP